MKTEVVIAAPLPHQLDFYESDARFKVLLCGRRWGKSKVSVACASLGHGPQLPNGMSTFPGIAHGPGYDVGWLAPNNKQSRKVWAEEIKPRFEGIAGVDVNETEKTVRVKGGGTLWLFSLEAVENIRGARLAGMIIDEARNFGSPEEFDEVWRKIVRPTLVDLRGWAIIPSTPAVGSGFNQLCHDIQDGKKRPSWKLFSGPSEENSLLSREELEEMRAEYPPGSTDMLEEMDAQLITEKGSLFDRSMFARTYQAVTPRTVTYAPWKEMEIPFVETILICDLAASLKEKADYTVIKAVGITDKLHGARRAAVLEVVRDKLEGPDQISRIAAMIETYKPRKVLVEAVAYQLTAVQHLRRQCPRTEFVEVKPKGDKRSRAVAWAAMLGRGEVVFPAQATWLNDYVAEHIRFTGEDKNHDDMVDTGSMLAKYLDVPNVSGRGRSVAF